MTTYMILEPLTDWTPPTTLVNNSSYDHVAIGDFVMTRNGEVAKVLGWSAPHKPSSTGRIYVEWADGSKNEYFPGVFDTTFV